MSTERRFGWAVLGTGTGVCLFAAWITFHIGGDAVTLAVDDFGTAAAALFGAVAAVVAAIKASGRARRGWAVLSAALFAWAAGELIWSWYEVVLNREVPSPSPADIGYLAGVGLGVAALLAFPSAPTRIAGRLRALLDGLIIAGSMLFVSWAFVLGPIFRAGGDNALAQAIALAYPVGDVVTVALVLVVLARASRVGHGRVPLVLIGVALLAMAFSDSIYAALAQNGSYASGNLIDVGWVLAYALMGLAALRPTDDAGDEVHDDLKVPLGRLLLPYIPFVVAVMTALVLQVFVDPLSPFLFATGLVLVLLVVARQLLMLLENHALNSSLESTVVALRAREDELKHLAFHDPLTNLANRALFRDRVENAAARRTRNAMPLGVVFLDLDDFKRVNDTLGHEAGDELLVAVAERLRACVRPGDTVARIGGDEFAILLDAFDTGPADARRIAQRILDALDVSFIVSGREITVHASLGIAMTDVGHAGADGLLRDADVAMYAAKADGKGRYEVFEERMRLLVIDRLELKAELRDAFDHDQIDVHFQPVVALASGRVIGAEALARWNHPTRGAVSPLEFIPLAEETGLIVAVGRMILAQACAQARRWRAHVPGASDMAVHVNVSARQLQQHSLVGDVAAALSASGLSPSALVLEITESTLVGDSDATIARLQALRDLGVRLAVDDFGTGYSSLAYLPRLPVDMIKIDKAFVDSVEGGTAGAAALTGAVVALGSTLGLETVAEGIETEAQLRALRDLGCLAGQGYLYARPCPADEFLAMLQAAAADGNCLTPAAALAAP